MLINELPRYEILDEAAMQELERGWRRIVSELGIEFLHEEALDVLQDAGQDVEGQLVKFDPDWILEQVAKAPAEFTLQARNPERSRADRRQAHGLLRRLRLPVRARGARAARTRPTTTSRTSCKLSQSFPQLDSPGGTICEPDDVPLDSRHLDMVFALLTL